MKTGDQRWVWARAGIYCTDWWITASGESPACKHISCWHSSHQEGVWGGGGSMTYAKITHSLGFFVAIRWQMTCSLKVNIWHERRCAKKNESWKILNELSGRRLGKAECPRKVRRAFDFSAERPQIDQNKDLICNPPLSSGWKRARMTSPQKTAAANFVKSRNTLFVMTTHAEWKQAQIKDKSSQSDCLITIRETTLTCARLMNKQSELLMKVKLDHETTISHWHTFPAHFPVHRGKTGTRSEAQGPGVTG